MSEARFTPHSLAEILRDRFLDESSGCLTLSAQTGEEIRIHLFRGLIDMALQTGPHREFLSDLVAKARKVKALPPDLRDGPPDPARLAAFLGDEMKKPEIIKAVRREAIVSIQEAFRLSGGTWRLEEDDKTGLFEPDVVSTLEAILKGINAVKRWAHVARILASQDRMLVPSAIPLFPIDQLPLAPEEGYLLSLMDGDATFTQIDSLFPGSDPDQVTRFVYSALVIGAVEFDPALDSPFRLEQYAEKEEDKRLRAQKEREKIESFYTMLSGGTPYQVLGVTDGVSGSEIKQAYEDRKASYQTEKFLPEIRQSCREELQIISTGLTYWPAVHQGVDADYGTVSEGKYADIIAVREAKKFSTLPRRGHSGIGTVRATLSGNPKASVGTMARDLNKWNSRCRLLIPSSSPPADSATSAIATEMIPPRADSVGEAGRPPSGCGEPGSAYSRG